MQKSQLFHRSQDGAGGLAYYFAPFRNGLYFKLLGNIHRLFFLDAEITGRAFNVLVTEQNLRHAQVGRLAGQSPHLWGCSKLELSGQFVLVQFHSGCDAAYPHVGTIIIVSP